MEVHIEELKEGDSLFRVMAEVASLEKVRNRYLAESVARS